jgi:hypothetical protein
MLTSTRICIKCAGRLHQLFDFNLIKVNLDSQDLDMSEDCCHFCNGNELMRERLNDRAREALEATKWIEVHDRSLIFS